MDEDGTWLPLRIHKQCPSRKRIEWYSLRNQHSWQYRLTNEGRSCIERWRPRPLPAAAAAAAAAAACLSATRCCSSCRAAGTTRLRMDGLSSAWLCANLQVSPKRQNPAFLKSVHMCCRLPRALDFFWRLRARCSSATVVAAARSSLLPPPLQVVADGGTADAGGCAADSALIGDCVRQPP